MKRENFLKRVIALLVLINIATLTYIWMQKDSQQPRGEGALEYLTKELNLSDAQQQQFKALRDEHRASHKPLREKGKKLHDNFFDALKGNDSLLVDRLADSIAVFQKVQELSTFYHFKKIRAICTEEQKKQFDGLIKETMMKMAPPPSGHIGPAERR